jgi:uncharacterized protein (TIGR01244 family)
MFSPRKIAEGVWAAPQIAAGDLDQAASLGVRLIVNNRPDAEEGNQPTSAEIEAAARGAGLAYVHIPVAGMPGPDAVAKMAIALATDQPMLMFCRSGTRSTIAWALAMRSLGRGEPDDLRAAAAAAGYDLSRVPL